MKEQIDIGIITVIPTEIKAIKKVLNLSDETVESEYGHQQYFRGSFYSKISDREVTVVLTYLTKEAGNTEAAIATKQFLTDWYPKIMCLVGIAAGLKGAVKIADVVIPNKVVDRTIKTFENGEYNPRSVTYQRTDGIDSELKQHSLDRDMFQQIVSEELKEEIDRALETATKMGIPKDEFNGNISVRDGSIWTDNTLIRDSTYFDGFKKFDEKCRGGEMEAGGFIRACQTQRATLPWLVFRGVSDFGDTNKSDDFQLLAAQCAAVAFRETFINCIDVDRIENDPRISVQQESLQMDIIKQIREAYEAKRWSEVCRIAPIISRYLWTSGQYDLRIEIGRMVDEAAKLTGKDDVRSAALVDDVGWTLFASHNNKNEAVANIKDGLRIAEDIHEYYIAAKGHRHLASIARREKEFDRAKIELEKAKECAEKIENQDKKAEIEASLVFSTLKLNVENDECSETWIDDVKEAISRFQNLNDLNREVKIYHYVGLVFLKDGNKEHAEEWFEKGLNLAYQIGRYDEIKDNTLELIKMSEDEFEKRKQYISRVIDFCKSQKLNSEIRFWKSQMEVE